MPLFLACLMLCGKSALISMIKFNNSGKSEKIERNREMQLYKISKMALVVF